ncbi:MAG: hypothetical protein IRZ32_02200 [Solirubrobacteraceae bacterium]|nr:hypothetical protein [Solirubrobacteraceae bacterium]
MPDRVPPPRRRRPVHRGDAVERVLAGVAAAVLAAVLAGVVLGASPLVTVLVAAGVVVLALAIAEVL